MGEKASSSSCILSLTRMHGANTGNDAVALRARVLVRRCSDKCWRKIAQLHLSPVYPAVVQTVSLARLRFAISNCWLVPEPRSSTLYVWKQRLLASYSPVLKILRTLRWLWKPWCNLWLDKGFQELYKSYEHVAQVILSEQLTCDDYRQWGGQADFTKAYRSFRFGKKFPSFTLVGWLPVGFCFSWLQF